MMFPLIQYHAPFGAGGELYNKHGNNTKTRFVLDEIYLDSPKTAWGSHDGTQLNGHGGRGVSRNVVYPSKARYVPGGVFDSNGLHVPILDLDAPQNPPAGIKGFSLAVCSLFRTFNYRFSFGEPEQLTLEDFKARLIALHKQEKRMPRPIKKIEAAETFYDVMLAEIMPEIMDHYYGPVEVKNWLNERKRY